MVQTMGTAESLPQHLLLLCLQLFLSLILTSLLHCSCTGVIASSEICYPRTVVSVVLGTALSSSGSVLEPASLGSVGYQGIF